MKKLFTLITLLTLCTLSAMADLPFRNHRYDVFKVLPIDKDDIVFIGNSITNMHEWWEAFGSKNNIKNRGVSGAVTDEALANIESVAAGKPKKVFIMIGTNDLGTSGINNTEHVLNNVALMVERFQKVSPETKIHIQSILPSTIGIRTLALEKATNDALKELCDERGIIYIDLWDNMQGILDYTHSLDGLHLSASGYKVWCDKIAPYVLDEENATSVYPANTLTGQNTGGLSGSYGMRATQFSMLPVNEGDILIIGDEMIHGGEWHELLQSEKVKSRGTAWGYPGPTISQLKSHIPCIFNTTSGSCKPSKVILYAGAADANSGTSATTMFSTYKSMVTQILQKAPDTKVYMMSLMPTTSSSTNSSYVMPFNDKLKSYAEENNSDNIEYIDIYTPLSSGGTTNSNYFSDNYLYGMGYVKVAQCIASALSDEGLNAITDETAAACYNRFELRTELGNAIATASLLQEGDEVGEYSSENLAEIKSKIDEAYALLSDDNTTTEEMSNAGTAITNTLYSTLGKINMPRTSNDDNEVWYQLYTPNRDCRYLTGNGIGETVTGEAANNRTRSMWKFVMRNDGSLNIVNRNDNSYLNPSAAYNTAISTSESEPSAGWVLSYSNSAGLFIISSNDVQLNQTQSDLGYKVYNWSSQASLGCDRNDTGCQYKIIVAGEPEVTELETDQVGFTSELVSGWYQIKAATGSNSDMQTIIDNSTNYIVAAENEYRQTTTNYYSLKYSAIDNEHPAAAYIYITKQSNGYIMQGVGGHYINENATSSRTIPGTATSISIADGIAVLGKWAPYNSGGDEQPYVGKYSNTSHTHKIYFVTDEKLAEYDIYTVTITNDTKASEIGNDARVTCSNNANQGIESVYNNGKFFFPVGTSVSTIDFTAPEQGDMYPTITIEGKFIKVNYTVKNSIEEIYTSTQKNTDSYDLSGRKIQGTPKGIHIVNGKKRLITK